MRRLVLLAGLVAAFGIAIAQPARADVTYSYTYMATATDLTSRIGDFGTNAVQYAPGGNVTMAIYLVETITAGSGPSFIGRADMETNFGGLAPAGQYGLFSSAVSVNRLAGTGDSGASLNENNAERAIALANPTLYSQNANNNGATNPFTGTNNKSTAIPGGVSGVASQNLSSGVPTPVPGTTISGVGYNGNDNGSGSLARYANPGITNGDGQIYPLGKNTPSHNSTTDGQNGSDQLPDGTRTVQFIGSITFSGGTAGTTTNFKLTSAGSADPLTYLNRYSLSANGVGGTTVGNDEAHTLLPAGVNWIGTNAFAGFDIAVTVTGAPEPSSMLLGAFAVCGFGYYRRRQAKKAAVAV